MDMGQLFPYFFIVLVLAVFFYFTIWMSFLIPKKADNNQVAMISSFVGGVIAGLFLIIYQVMFMK